MRWLALALLVLIGAPQASAQAPSETAVIAVGGDPGHLNPAISTAGPLHAVAASLFNGLVALDPDGNPVPELAESWAFSNDGTTVTFRLRAGVEWHDGRPFTASDVRFTFEQVLFRLHARARAGLAPAVATISAPDDRTVVFQLKRPHPALLRQLDVTEAPILPRHVYGEGEIATHAANLNPVGTGPFRFESYRQGDQVVLVRNTRYFKPGLPHLDRLVFRVIPKAATQVNALSRGEIDMLQRVAPADVERLRSRPVTLMETRSAAGGANCIMTVSFNLQRPALADRRVREAFARTVDRQQILERVVFGQGRVAEAPIGSGIGWAHAPGLLAGYRPDIAAANRLLDEAGLPRDASGQRLTLDMLHFPAFARYSELMRQHLAQVGIALRVRTLDPAAFAQAVFTRRDFDIALISYCNGTDPEIGVRRMVHSSTIGAVPFSNAAAYSNAEVDRLFDAASRTVDDRERGALYRQAQAIIARDLPYWWLVETDFTAAWNAGFSGFAPWGGQFAETARRSR
ncbi:ABC transporter substrate-binding protein [Phreatobacter sp.]|uniref:ABC transporter substrate-binding protein n=1 Tax=Phreatobacter sp. TaxID=1966341 RepID=UPI003F6F731C